MNDERTITAIKNRNEAAINEVITKYSKLLWAVAGAVLNNMGSTQDVEECVADTFIYLWEHPDKYDPQRGKLKTWHCCQNTSSKQMSGNFKTEYDFA